MPVQHFTLPPGPEGCYVKLANWTQPCFMQGIREGFEWTSQSGWGKVQAFYILSTGHVLCFQWDGFFLSLFVLKFWAAELTLWLFFSRVFEGSRQKGGLWSFSPKSSLLSLQTWVWLRLRYRATLSSTVVMKLARCFDLSTGRPTCNEHAHSAMFYKSEKNH